MITCQTCGHANTPGAAFCSQCASNLRAGSGFINASHGVHGYSYATRGTTILVLGILSLVVCGIMGPIAWAMGNSDLREIDRGNAPPDERGSIVAGRICGMIATILLGVSLLFVVAIAGVASSHW
ncbi:MAG: hypothetical protein WKG01_25080 [Kofleriaceae bacterium]